MSQDDCLADEAGRDFALMQSGSEAKSMEQLKGDGVTF